MIRSRAMAALLIVLVFAFPLVASASSKIPIDSIDLSLYTEEELVDLRDKINIALGEDGSQKNKKVTTHVEPNLVYSDENISITYSDISVKTYTTDSYLLPELLFENKASSIINFVCESIIVNGYAFDVSRYVDLPANTKYLHEITADGDQYVKLGIQNVETFGMVFNYTIRDGHSRRTDSIQTPVISISAENGAESEQDTVADIDAIVEKILSYKNDGTDDAYKLIQQYGDRMTAEQLMNCLLSYGRWMCLEPAEAELKTYLKSPRSYYRYSGSITTPELQEDGTYKVTVKLKYGATNSFGGEVTDDVTVYVAFRINTDEKETIIIGAELSALDKYLMYK